MTRRQGDQVAIALERGADARIDSLRGLWLELHHLHARVGPQSGVFTDDETSWRYRSASYREWLADPRAFCLIARRGSDPLGYAMVRVFASEAHELDSWRVPEVVAELETLVVAERARGSGIGGHLLELVDRELERLGIDELVVGVIPGNEEAQRLYERRGFKPRWLELVRSSQRT